MTRSGNDLWVYTLSDLWVYTLSDRSMALWTLGYPEAALADVRHVAKDSHDLGRVASLAYAVATTSRVCILCGRYTAANAQLDEAIAWTDEKGAVFWRALVELSKGCVFALPGKASDALQMLTSGIAAWRSTRSTAALPMYLSDLAIAYSEHALHGKLFAIIGACAPDWRFGALFRAKRGSLDCEPRRIPRRASTGERFRIPGICTQLAKARDIQCD